MAAADRMLEEADESVPIVVCPLRSNLHIVLFVVVMVAVVEVVSGIRPEEVTMTAS